MKRILIDSNYWCRLYSFGQQKYYNDYYINFFPNISNLNELIVLDDHSYIRLLFDDNYPYDSYNFTNNTKDVSSNFFRYLKPDYYRNIVMSSPVKFYILDDSGTEVYINDYAIDVNLIDDILSYRKNNNPSNYDNYDLSNIDGLLNKLMFSYILFVVNDSYAEYEIVLDDIQDGNISFNYSLEVLYFDYVSNIIFSKLKNRKVY